MKRCAAALLALLMLALAAALPAFAQKERSFEMPEFDLPCRAAILVDQASGTVLYEKQADQPLPIASITKVMTLLLTMEALESGKASLTDVVPVSEHAYNMGGSQIWLEPGEQLTMDEMLKAICVSSANDAAVAVAEYIGGSEPVFVEQMNRKAAEQTIRACTAYSSGTTAKTAFTKPSISRYRPQHPTCGHRKD